MRCAAYAYRVARAAAHALSHSSVGWSFTIAAQSRPRPPRVASPRRCSIRRCSRRCTSCSRSSTTTTRRRSPPSSPSACARQPAPPRPA
jgi:hypothetical protein